MIDVSPFFWCLSTTFQTLETQGHVVSTTSTFCKEKKILDELEWSSRLNRMRRAAYESLLVLVTSSEDHIPTYLLVKIVHFFQRRTKGGQNDHIPILDRLVFLPAISKLLNKLHIHFIQVVVDLGVVDQLVGNMDLAIREMIDCLVGESDAPFDTPAKAKILM